MKPIHDSYQNFINTQLLILQQRLSKNDLGSGREFIDFILKILSSAEINRRPFYLSDFNQETFIKHIWNAQSSWWAHAETLPTYFSDMAILMKWFKLNNHVKDVLSVGCGPGLHEIFLEHTLADKFSSITATDISSNMISVARNNQKQYEKQYGKKSKVKFKIEDFQTLSMADNSMDAIICDKVLHWCFAKQDAIRNVFRILRPCGLFMIILPKTDPQIILGEQKFNLGNPIDAKELGVFITRELSGVILDYTEIKLPYGFGQTGGAVDDQAILFQKT